MDIAVLAEHYAALPMRPFRVVFHLSTPLVIGTDPLCLDSLLAHRVALELFGPAAFDRSRSLVDLPLPLKRTGEVWHASIGFPGELTGRGQDFMVKRWSTPVPPRISKSIGWSKTYLLPVAYVATPSVTFYGNGNLAEIKRLLSTVQAIGRWRKKGFGQVRKVSVEPIAKDLSLWCDGQPQRPIPISQVDQPYRYFTAATGFRPPTWVPRNQGLCVMPTPDRWFNSLRTAQPKIDADEEAWEEVLAEDDGTDRHA